MEIDAEAQLEYKTKRYLRLDGCGIKTTYHSPSRVTQEGPATRTNSRRATGSKKHNKPGL